MEFAEALRLMESGKTVRRPTWTAWLFLDIDDNIKCAGERCGNESLWHLQIQEKDWEECMDVELNEQSNEIEQARLQAMMDQNSANIKRLYYLEEIMDSHHKSVKRFTDMAMFELETTRKALSTIVKFISGIKDTLKELQLDRKELNGNTANDIKLKKSIDSLITVIEKKLNIKNTELSQEDQKELDKIKIKIESKKKSSTKN